MTLQHTLPQHVAIVMDGNGRWAEQQYLPRIAGHKTGVESVREVVRIAAEKNIKILSLFAFGQDNWRRPADEVSFLMNLFLTSLRAEVKKLHKNNIHLQVIGDRSQFNHELQQAIEHAETLTRANTGLKLILAVNYSGQWDIVQASQKLAAAVATQQLIPTQITRELFQGYLSTAHIPEPDLFIRTSGEHRISNFMLWQLAYTELYFTETLWPNFREPDFEAALDAYGRRERRFGCTQAQLKQQSHA